ncbi:uncharacterized protein LOC122954543 [Acropora millepora]|uniref:uncharacterized protein LOC122954543 n=1 Tax=Acropora millepora TaxID=45264 RepID=UPI001CF341D0|nr:uncharacterized protein LOC122954543 [Acropora millepora]
MHFTEVRQFRAPPSFLGRHCAKTRCRQVDLEKSSDVKHLNVLLDGTIQGHSLRKNTNVLSHTKKPENIDKTSDELGANTTRIEFPSALEKPAGAERSAEMNRGQLADLHRSLQTRLKGPTIDNMKKYPLSGMTCTGQRVDLTQGQQNRNDIGITDEICASEVVNNGKTAGVASHSNAVSLNKLYSSLKKIKCRRNDLGHYEDLATISMNSREPGLGRSYFQRTLPANKTARQPVHEQRATQEEIFLLVGGKSKPVRYEINPDGLNLLEKEWHVELKSRDSLFCNPSGDSEGLKLLQKFRARFRLQNQRHFLGRKTPNLPIPWARHVVHRGRNQSPEERDKLNEDEAGRKLSIHVYLPNAGWDEQRSSTPATPMVSPSR